jgi:hypothetical protein
MLEGKTVTREGTGHSAHSFCPSIDVLRHPLLVAGRQSLSFESILALLRTFVLVTASAAAYENVKQIVFPHVTIFDGLSGRLEEASVRPMGQS